MRRRRGGGRVKGSVEDTRTSTKSGGNKSRKPPERVKKK